MSIQLPEYSTDKELKYQMIQVWSKDYTAIMAMFHISVIE